MGGLDQETGGNPATGGIQATGGRDVAPSGGNESSGGSAATPTGGMDERCGNGVIDDAEGCDLGSAPPASLNICVDCEIDTSQFDLITDPALLRRWEGDGRAHYYYPVNASVFDTAQADCELTGAYVVTIRSDDEVAIVEDLLRAQGFYASWINAQDYGPIENPRPEWLTTEPWDYLPRDEYARTDASHNCLVFSVEGGMQQFRDRACDNPSGRHLTVCEWVAPGLN